MADDKELEESEETGKKKKKKEKNKEGGGSFDATVGDNGAMFTDAEEEEGGGLSVALIIILIVIIWLAILALLVKLDIGGFGSGVLYPILKDVPVVKMILPDVVSDEVETEDEYATLADAVTEINRLKRENEDLKKKQSTDNSEEINAYREEIKRLQTFEDSQVEFQKLKTEFYEEVVFSDNAPSIEEYRKYYEEIDPENAEYLYKQVVQQMATDQEMSDYVKAYSDMKPQQAAKIFEMMPDNLDLVAKILGKMDATTRGKILGKMDQEVAAQITKIMDPD
ncbi:MAG: hypothetical protein IKS87_00540 [Lachnospiraceae bacterium]|nr:hypothetical protein [Lachnospiraceae bacterium]